MRLPIEAQIRSAQRTVNQIRGIVGDLRATSEDANALPLDIKPSLLLESTLKNPASTFHGLVRLHAEKQVDIEATKEARKRNDRERDELQGNRIATILTAALSTGGHLLKHGAVETIRITTVPVIPPEVATSIVQGVADFGGEVTAVGIPLFAQFAKEKRNSQRKSLDDNTALLHEIEWNELEKRFMKERAVGMLRDISRVIQPSGAPELDELLTDEVRTHVEQLRTRQEIHRLGKGINKQEHQIAQTEHAPTAEEVSTYRKKERLAIAALVEDFVLKDQTGWFKTPEGRRRIFDLLKATNEIQSSNVRAWNRPDAIKNFAVMIAKDIVTGPTTTPQHVERAKELTQKLLAIESRRGRKIGNLKTDLQDVEQLIQEMAYNGELNPQQTAELLQMRFDLATPFIDMRRYKTLSANLVTEFYRMTSLTDEQRVVARKAERVIDGATELIYPNGGRLAKLIGLLPERLQQNNLLLNIRLWDILIKEVPQLKEAINTIRSSDVGMGMIRLALDPYMVGSTALLQDTVNTEVETLRLYPQYREPAKKDDWDSINRGINEVLGRKEQVDQAVQTARRGRGLFGILGAIWRRK